MNPHNGGCPNSTNVFSNIFVPHESWAQFSTAWLFDTKSPALTAWNREWRTLTAPTAHQWGTHALIMPWKYDQTGKVGTVQKKIPSQPPQIHYFCMPWIGSSLHHLPNKLSFHCTHSTTSRLTVHRPLWQAHYHPKAALHCAEHCSRCTNHRHSGATSAGVLSPSVAGIEWFHRHSWNVVTREEPTRP